MASEPFMIFSPHACINEHPAHRKDGLQFSEGHAYQMKENLIMPFLQSVYLVRTETRICINTKCLNKLAHKLDLKSS